MVYQFSDLLSWMDRATGLNSSSIGVPIVLDFFIDVCMFLHQDADDCARLVLAKFQSLVQSEKVSGVLYIQRSSGL